jgi:hypothetical protein
MPNGISLWEARRQPGLGLILGVSPGWHDKDMTVTVHGAGFGVSVCVCVCVCVDSTASLA